jgi:hypothetical protein
VQTYTSILAASTQTTTVQQVVTQYSTIPGSTQTITQTTMRDGTTAYIERTTTAPAQTSTIIVTQNEGTVTQTNDAQTLYVTATTTMPAASVYFVNDRTVTQSGMTVTVAYCPCYPGMKFARQENGTHVYQHCDC